MSKTRTRWVIAAVVAAALVAGSGFAYTAIKSGRECGKNQANADAAPTMSGPSAGPKAFIIGDSLATGWGLDKTTDSFAYKLVKTQGWNATLAGFPGTGYVTDGACGNKSFDARLDTLRADTEVVIVEGGTNDSIFEESGVDKAAAQLLREVERRAPSAKVYVLGVPKLPSLTTKPRAEVDTDIHTAADNAGATYVDLSAVAVETTDGTHPTSKSASAIAEAIAEALN